MLIRKTFKYRILDPSKQIANKLDWVLWKLRTLYNDALTERRLAYSMRGVSVSYYDQAKALPEIKEIEPDYREIGSHVLQDTLLRLDKAFQGFFRRVKAGSEPGYPRYKARGNFDSFTYPDSAGWKRMRDAITANETAQHLVRFSQVHKRAQDLVEFVAEIDPGVARALGHVQVELLPRSREEIDTQYNILSLTHDPSAFDVSTRPDYHVPAGKDRLLILACSKGKPYRNSKSHRTVFRFLREHVGERLESCHKVTLSGLYGPVPLEFEDEQAVHTYEYVLSSRAKRQQELVTSRLAGYLEAHLHEYRRIVAYVTAGAYRSVVEAAFAQVRERYERTHGQDTTLGAPLILAPATTRGTGTKDLLSHASLEELLGDLYSEECLPAGPPVQLTLKFRECLSERHPYMCLQAAIGWRESNLT